MKEARHLINIDVPDIEAAIKFYTNAFDLKISRIFDNDFVELTGYDAHIYLLKKKEGTLIGPAGGGQRDYHRHWSPIHLDFSVSNLDNAVSKALAAGAVQESEISDHAYGRLAIFADPFGHGFCLIEFNEKGYDALL